MTTKHQGRVLVTDAQWRNTLTVEVDELKGTVAQMIYRGPDEYSLYRDQAIGLGVASLSIILRAF